MSYRIQGLSPDSFRPLFGLSDDALAEHGARRYVVDKTPGFPDRIEVRDAEVGDTVLLVNYTHQPADNPYHASHAIFVREGAETAFDTVDVIPEVLRVRTISLRAFDMNDEMIDADVVDGTQLEPVIHRFFHNTEVAYLQAHYAKRGCYAARVERA